MIRWLLGLEKNKTHSKIFYIHPREVDAQSRRINLTPVLNFLHHYGLSFMPKKVEKVISDYPWSNFEKNI